ncbi:TauD-domain-containing protein [Xylariomycetidae sp. FL2044]|nr:TauD-domain-containing protein [Xylariomycetidae sp. FL2044]
MAPSATETVVPVVENVKQKLIPGNEQAPAEKASDDADSYAIGSTSIEADLPKLETAHKEPLKLSGALDQFKQFEVTPIIGKEFVDVDLAEWLRAPNSDELIRDLAITISRRGVVFFRKQDTMTNDLQKELVQRLGQLSGKPSTSKLHIHPVINSGRGEHGDKDDEISVISSVSAKKIYAKQLASSVKSQSQKAQWHSDITFEPVPSDYALLRMTQLPETGGDTLWASGYELYDRISKPLRGFLDTLTAYYAQPMFNEAAANNNFKIYSAERGAPENVGELLEAVHPVVRTNPVTGWKSVFAVGHHVKSIHGLSEAESAHFLQWFVQLIVENHDLQVRNRWQNVNDLAIWDNRSVYHAATPDYLHQGLGERSGSRAVSLGEKPYFDPQSVSRREGLAAEI